MAATTGRPRVACPLCAVLLLGMAGPALSIDLGSAIGGTVEAVKKIFGDGSDNDSTSQSSTAQQGLGPIVIKTAQAFQYAAAPPHSSHQGGTPLQLQGGSGSNVTVHRSGPHSITLSFMLEGAADQAAAGSERVPFLEQFVETSEAPRELLDAFMPLVEGPDTQGSLADAVEETMGTDPLLHIICTGERGGGGLALLCGPWAALQCPTANADIIAFAASWEGFNTQFSWSLAQLVTLHYTWPFDSSAADLVSVAGSSGGGGSTANNDSLAAVLSSLITADSLQQAVAIPNMPPPMPPDYTPDTSDNLGSLAPASPEQEPPAITCPLILCKTRDAIAAACLSFSNESLQTHLPGLPATRLHAASGADAIVAWNASALTGIIMFEGSESKIDWLQDAITFFSDDFRPGNLSAVLPDVKVHRGFLNQFSSLTTNPTSDVDNITAVLLNLSGGRAPDRLVIAGHSELAGVWASTVWPTASVLVANSGAPRVGNDAWELEFTSVVGRAYRFVNHLDQVPELPPFSSFKQVPHGIWLRNDLVLLQDRPPFKRDQTTWDDHNCETLYVPPVLNASAVTVPSWIYNTTAAA